MAAGQLLAVTAILAALVSPALLLAEDSDGGTGLEVPGRRQGRDSYLDAYHASHASAAGPNGGNGNGGNGNGGHGNGGHGNGGNGGIGPSYGAPPHRGYPPAPPSSYYHGPVMYQTAPEYGGPMEPQDGGGGGSGGVDVVTFMHALGKVLVVKIIVKLVATILALLILPKIKDKKKRKPSGHKPHHRPQGEEEEEDEDEEDEEDEEEEDDDDEERRAARGGARAMRTALLHSIETSSWDPRLLDLAGRVFQGIHRWTPSDEADDGDSADAWTADARPPTLAS